MIQHHNYENMSLYEILETFSHYQQVSFAFYCAKDVESLANNPIVIECNQQIQRWLKGDKHVDLDLTRNGVLNTWRIANDASSSAADATWHASYATANFSAFGAYYAASSATNAKSYSLYPNDNAQRTIACEQFLNEYNQIAQNWLSHWNIPNFPKDEPDFPIFDFLQDYNLISSLLPKKEDYYYLNLNGFDIKHVNEAELLKEIDTMHIKTILRRIINNDSTS